MFLYWIIKGKLAGSSEPHITDIPYLKEIPWGGLVSLQETPNTKDLALMLNIPYLNIPILDFSIPSSSNIEQIIEFYTEYCEKTGLPLLIHCTAGHGRTGTVLASLLVILENLTPEEAMMRIRKVNPLAIETKDQELFVNSLKSRK
ncbi:phosphatase domain-containing protein [Candidatus Hodarchaeum mangrovi]